MGTLNPRPRGVRNLDTERKAATADRQQTRRLLSLREKPPVPVASGGAGIIGIAEVEAQTSSLIHDASGLDFGAVRYNAPWDFGIAGLQRASEFVTVETYKVFLEPGTYSVACRIDYGWVTGTTPPGGIQVALVNQGSSSDAPHGGWDQLLPITVGSTGVGISRLVNAGPTVISDGGYMLPNVQHQAPFPAQVPGSAVHGVNGDPTVHWTFWRWS